MSITNSWVQQQIAMGNYELSGHAETERQADKLHLSDLENALSNPEILEDYPSDPRGESCLILGYAIDGQSIHFVVGRGKKGMLRIITVYLPTLPRWLNERTRSNP
jgi:hypothetical protein